mgnify:CR=1 FL=1
MIEPVNVDRPIGKNYFRDVPDDTLLITDIFPTVQGEGPYAGQRALFLRLAGCNYGGKGVVGKGCLFCDTSFFIDKAKPYTFDELVSAFDARHPGSLDAQQKTKLVVVTGGEPLLQKNLISFIENTEGYFFQIETNGTQRVYPKQNCHVVVSPKVPQRVDAQRGGSYPVLNSETMRSAHCLKFVVSADKESPYHNIPQYAFRFQELGKPVYVSPMAVYRRPPPEPASIWDGSVYDQAACADNTSYAFYLAQTYGFRVSMQTHLYGAVK